MNNYVWQLIILRSYVPSMQELFGFAEFEKCPKPDWECPSFIRSVYIASHLIFNIFAQLISFE